MGVPWYGWAAAALVVALLFAFVVPANIPAGVSSLAAWVLRWGHALVWLFLALFFLARGTPAVAAAATLPALLALASYGLYLFALLTQRR